MMGKGTSAVGSALGLIGTLGLGALVGHRFLHPEPYEARVTVRSNGASDVVLAVNRDALRPGTYRLRRDGEGVRVGAVIEVTDATVRREASSAAAVGEWAWDALIHDSVDAALDGARPGGSSTHVIHVHGQSSGPRQVLRGLPVWDRLGARSEVLDLTGLPERSLDARAADAIVRRVAAARQAGATRVVLQGWSAGALACSVAASRVAVDAVIGISPLLSVRSALRGAVRGAHLPGFVGAVAHRVLTTPGLCRLAGAPAAVRIDRWVPGGGPTLVLHSRADHLVAEADVRALKADRGVQTAAFETAPHTLEWNEDPERWEGLVEDFARRHSLAQ